MDGGLPECAHQSVDWCATHERDFNFCRIEALERELKELAEAVVKHHDVSHQQEQLAACRHDQCTLAAEARATLKERHE